MQIEVTIDGLEEFLAEWDGIEAGKFIAEQLRKQVPALSQIHRQQYEINRKLPYSPAYIGRLKPSGKHRAGVAGDPGFAIDTSALYDDATSNFEVVDDTLIAYSDLAYAGYIADLINDKGSTFYAADDVYLDLLERAIAASIQQ